MPTIAASSWVRFPGVSWAVLFLELGEPGALTHLQVRIALEEYELTVERYSEIATVLDFDPELIAQFQQVLNEIEEREGPFGLTRQAICPFPIGSPCRRESLHKN